jgi:hypothetical protein
MFRTDEYMNNQQVTNRLRRGKDDAMTKRKRTNNDITQKTKERATGTLPKPRGEHMCFTRLSISCSDFSELTLLF